MHTPTRMERLRYRFDNFMARGTIALIAGLFLASARRHLPDLAS